MDGIKIQVTGNIAKVTEKPKRIIAGTIGLPVEFFFDETWDDIVKTAVFVAGENVSRLDEIDGKTTVPWEVLQNPGPWLSIGVYGESSDGEKSIPTTWANVSPILFGTSLSGDPTDPAAAPIWQKLKNEMENVRDLVEEGYISNASINKDGELELTFMDGSVVNVGKVVGGSDIVVVDNLGSGDSNAALSARMGSVLKAKIEDDISALNEQLQPQINQRVKTVNGVAPDENGNVEVQGGGGGSGEPGEDGFSPIATVTQTGSGAVISITDKSGTTTANVFNGKDGKDGYTPVKGVDYFDGAPGKDGVDGKDGAQGNPGKDGADGKDGANGKDGVSATHSWNGTTLTITSASGTSSANLKGEKGEKGDKGDQGIQGEKGDTGAAGSNGTNGKDGANGTSVTVKSVSESTADGGSNVVTFSDGKTVTIKNGSKGSTGSAGKDGAAGKNGADGYTPVRGVDYYTEADKVEIVQRVIESLGGNPIFGVVDSNNHIVLNGDLADGTYSVKYEMEDGSKVSIGDLVLDTNVYYTVTNNLTNCTTNNSAKQVVEGESYSATITAQSGYELKSVTVTMGGSPVTVSGGVINIANVTGNIVITAVAEEIKANYTNLFKRNEATINNRLNSSAAVTPQDGYFITNIIDVSDKTPFTANTKIYVKSAILNDDGKSRIFTYLNTGTEYTGMQSSVQTKNTTITDEGNGVLSMSGLAAAFGSGTKRFVMCLKVSDAAITESDIQNFIITIDEPIV